MQYSNSFKRLFCIYSLLAVLFLVILSCSKSSDFAEYKFFPKELIIADELEEMPISVDLFLTWEMTATDSLLFILLSKGDELVKIFDIQTLEYLGGFGRQGEGPNEFFVAYQNGFHIYEGKTLSMMDRVSIRTVPVTIERNSENGKVVKYTLEEAQRHRLPSTMIPLLEGSLLNDSTVMGLNQIDENSQFITYDFINKKINYSHLFAPIDIKAIPFEKAHWLNSFVKVSRDHSKIVMAYEKLPLMRIIDLKGSEKDEVFVKTEDEILKNLITDLEGYPIKSNSMVNYYHDVELSDKYIFAGYYKQEISYNDNHEAQRVYYTGREIHVFDFDGNTITKIKLEDWMKQFAITPNSEFLYFPHPEKENSIFRYKLPKFE